MILCMNTENRKKVLLTPQKADEILKQEQPQYIEWGEEQIVITPDDIPSTNDCCFRSANMIDSTGKRSSSQVCTQCGRVFDVHNTLIGIDTTRADKIVAQVPRKEFLNED